eukprot:gb/GECH01004056.1/.p1 GENE.gb/GECH01004056.1/~~gb/GECH01004056.1/.p1  ORF type:complete len:307 (+),score=28.80 gb/GECH01004056.1/:1-921(+)
MGAQLLGFGVISLCVTCLWILSVMLHDTSIIDGFWGTGFVVLTWLYYFHPDTEGGDTNRKLLISLMISLWGLRLSLYLIWRNWGKGEDARYQRLRTKIGANYWWLSWILVFMLQGTLMPVIGYPILIAQAQEHASLFSLPSHDQPWSNTTALISLGSFMLDALGTITWMMGMFFEVVGDWQLAAFRSNPNNKGKVLDQGVWRYTRHANYFGDSAQWWGVFLFAAGASFSAAANNNNNNHSSNEMWQTILKGLISIYSPTLMTYLLLRITGVSLLEKGLVKSKPKYQEYIKTTSAFIPWFPKKQNQD